MDSAAAAHAAYSVAKRAHRHLGPGLPVSSASPRSDWPSVEERPTFDCASASLLLELALGFFFFFFFSSLSSPPLLRSSTSPVKTLPSRSSSSSSPRSSGGGGLGTRQKFSELSGQIFSPVAVAADGEGPPGTPPPPCAAPSP